MAKSKGKKGNSKSQSQSVEIPTLAGSVEGLDKVSRKGAKAEDDESKPRPMPQPKAVKPMGGKFLRLTPRMPRLR